MALKQDLKRNKAKKSSSNAKVSQTKPSKRRGSSPLLKLADITGDFIRHWGFRRIHGEIWTLLYLSPQPLSGADLVQKLGVSKALVSPALGELEDHQLIKLAGGDNKTKLYICEEDVMSVIRQVLSQREKMMIDKAAEAVSGVKTSPEEVEPQRLEKLKDLILSAQSTLDLLLSIQTKMDETGDPTRN